MLLKYLDRLQTRWSTTLFSAPLSFLVSDACMYARSAFVSSSSIVNDCNYQSRWRSYSSKKIATSFPERWSSGHIYQNCGSFEAGDKACNPTECLQKDAKPADLVPKIWNKILYPSHALLALSYKKLPTTYCVLIILKASLCEGRGLLLMNFSRHGGPLGTSYCQS